MNTRIKYNGRECGWECENCGGLFSDDEVKRMFNYDNIFTEKNFTPCFCMDCGSLFSEVDMTEYVDADELENENPNMEIRVGDTVRFASNRGGYIGINSIGTVVEELNTGFYVECTYADMDYRQVLYFNREDIIEVIR